MTKKELKERKRQKRLQLLELLDRDPKWYKTENALYHTIRETAEELLHISEEPQMKLTIENFRHLEAANISYMEMSKIFGISVYGFYRWRRDQGLLQEMSHC